MIPVTYPSSVSTSKESQMVVFALSSVAGLQRWTDYIPVKYQSTGSDVPNSFNTNGYIACDFITSLTGKQAWVDYVPVFVDNAATTAWQVSDTGFIPFNTLAGGGTYVSLDLNFLNTTALDSRITFSRGTNATLTDSNGLIAWAPHNLLTNSEDFEAAAWTKTASTITANSNSAPDGTMTADTLVETAATSGHVINSGATVTTSEHVFSVYLKKGSGSTAPNWIQLYTGGVSAQYANFNLGAGTVGSVAAGSTASITNVGNGWYRCTLTFTPGSGGTAVLAIAFTNNTDTTTRGLSYAGATTSDVFAWGAQLNVGSTAQSYNSTTPKNLLGFTQEPENAAWTKSNSYVQQNLLTWSQDFDNAAWVKLNGTVVSNQAIAPDGTTTAELLYPTTTGTFRGFYQTFTASAVVYTTTVYAKAAGLSSLGLTDLAGSAAAARFDLVSGTVGFTAAGYTASIQSVGNGWYRCSVTGTATAGLQYAYAYACDSASTNTATTSGTSGIFIWGAQLVQGSTAGDYTQTTSAAAPTRYTNWDGTLTGRKLVEDTVNTVHLVREPFTSTGVPYSLNVYAKAGERNFALIRTLDPSFDKYTWFNLANGTVGTTASGHAASIQSVGGGWYRCNVTYTFVAGSCFVYAGVANADNVSSYTGDGTSGIYVSDFQLANSASVDPYVYNPQAAAASAAYYGPRFDYDPVTLAARGLLIEEQRTNLLTYSEQFDNAAWTRTLCTVTANTTTAPDATLTADTVTDNSTSGTELSQTATVSSGATVSHSRYFKYINCQWIRLVIGGATDFIRGWFDIQNGVVGATSVGGVGTGATINITNVGNGWYRCTLGGALTGLTSYSVISMTADGNNVTNRVSGGSYYVWGAQLEAGSFATSYIPTVASQVTRNADSASMLGDNFYTWFNPNQGTLSGEASRSALGGNSPIATVFSATNTRMQVGNNTGGGGTAEADFYVQNAGADQAWLRFASAVTANVPFKIVGAYNLNNFGASANGAATLTDPTGTVPVATSLLIGASGTAGNAFNGTIRRINYYNTRLDNATLQALTT